VTIFVKIVDKFGADLIDATHKACRMVEGPRTFGAIDIFAVFNLRIAACLAEYVCGSFGHKKSADFGRRLFVRNEFGLAVFNR